MPYKKVALVLLALVVAYLAFPLMWLAFDVTADNMVAEFAYRRIAERYDTPEELNSWIYVNEEQGSWLDVNKDAIDKNCLFDLVRGVGWCDQKSMLLTKFLAIKGIEARSVQFPCHTFVQAGQRYYDPAFNKVGYYDGDCIKGVTPRLSSTNLTFLNGMHNIIYTVYPKQYIDAWLEFYLLRTNLVALPNVSEYYRDYYLDPDYIPLYKARLYHLYGLYDKVNYSVSPKFYGEAWFYSMVLNLDTDKPIDEHLKLAISEDKSYLSFIKPYLKRYNEVYK
jgi:hypothetical protein